MGLTGAGRNGIAGAAAFWDYMAAHRDLTIFWGFIPEHIYFDKAALSDKLKIGMLAVNIYHFFIRKKCLIPCLQNLFRTLATQRDMGILTQKRLKETLEILLIGYICGIVLMPGANQQFQFWFICFVPLLIDMVGLPQIFTFWITPYFYPILDKDPKHQHYFMLGLTAWLITIGPKDNFFLWILSLMP